MDTLIQTPKQEAILHVHHLKKSYHNQTILVDSSFSVKKGEFLSILGPSGCGKTTTLQLLVGLEHPDSGTIICDDVDVTHLSAAERNIGIVFQDYALFENMNVLENVMYPLKFHSELKARRKQIATDVLGRLGLSCHLNKRISELSGGQQQRVSIARTLALNPSIILFDEPMSALDIQTRLDLRHDLKALQHGDKTTMIYVTHDQEEAFALSDRIMIMHNGRIEQLDTPQEILMHPATEFVQSFVIDNLTKKIASLAHFEPFMMDADGSAS